MRFPIFPGEAPWNEGDSASLRLFLSQPTGQRLLSRLFYLRPEVSIPDGEGRRIQQDVHSGHERCIQDILTLADPAPLSEADLSAQTSNPLQNRAT
jgi:hypothetical protein